EFTDLLRDIAILSSAPVRMLSRRSFCRVEQPQKSLPAHAWGRFTRPMPWRNLFIPGALVQGRDRLRDLRIAGNQKPPALHISTAGRTARQDGFAEHRMVQRSPYFFDVGFECDDTVASWLSKSCSCRFSL